MPASNEALFRSHDQSALSGVDWEVAYRYDAFGNVLSRTETDHTAPSGSPESEAFDAYFHDIGQRSGGLGGLDDLLLTVDASGRTTRRFLHGPGVDEVLAEETVTDGTNLSNGTSSSTVTLWTLTDHLGSVVGWVGYELTGTAGAASGGSTTVEGWTRYSAFGQALTGPGSGSAGTGLASAVGTLHGYTGRWTDSRTGLQNNRARWYDAEAGRWASEDPIGFAAGDANLSRYVGNGPVAAVDPSGLEPNRAQVASVGDIAGLLETAEATGLEPNDFPGLFGIEGPRYVYTDDYGWVDMKHFFAGANTGGPVSACILGALVEVNQTFHRSRSAWSEEDMPSNLAGGNFGGANSWARLFGATESQADAFRVFMAAAGARDPKDPAIQGHINNLPETDDQGRNRKSCMPSNQTDSSDHASNAISDDVRP